MDSNSCRIFYNHSPNPMPLMETHSHKVENHPALQLSSTHSLSIPKTSKDPIRFDRANKATQSIVAPLRHFKLSYRHWKAWTVEALYQGDKSWLRSQRPARPHLGIKLLENFKVLLRFRDRINVSEFLLDTKMDRSCKIQSPLFF